MGGRLKVKYEKYNPEDCELHGKQYKCVITDKQLIYSEDWNDNEFICKITAENIVNYDKD